jgi:hypothetical protein
MEHGDKRTDFHMPPLDYQRRKYLVVRSDALQNAGRRQIRSSELWPCIVEAVDVHDALKVAYREFFGGEQRLPMNRPFTVIAMTEACEVTLAPINNYTVDIKRI